MPSLELRVNRRKLATAGFSGPGVISNIITWHRRRDGDQPRLSVSIGGLDTSLEPGEHVHWARRDLRPGDTVTVRLLRDAVVDPPRRETFEQARVNRPRLIRMELKNIEARRRQLERELKKLDGKSAPGRSMKSKRER